MIGLRGKPLHLRIKMGTEEISPIIESLHAWVLPGTALRLHSRYDSIHVRGPVGRCTLTTDGGEIIVEGVLHDEMRVSSRGHDVRITAAPGSSLTGDWSISSQGGNILLNIPASLSCRLAATSLGGDVDTAGLTLTSVRQEGSALYATLGAGGHELHLLAQGGDITIRSTHN